MPALGHERYLVGTDFHGQGHHAWLDGAGSEGHVYNFPRIIEELRNYQPNTLVFADTGLFEYGDIRWVGNEDGNVPYENWNVIDRHGFLRWRPVEVDTPLHKQHWFWHPNDESSLKSAADLITTYEQSVCRGAQLSRNRRGTGDDIEQDVPLRPEDHQRAEPNIRIELPGYNS